MSDRLVVARIFRALFGALAVLALFTSVVQAKDLQVQVAYNGTGQLVMMPSLEFPLPPNLVQTGAKGSFGAMSVTIMTQFLPQPPPAPVDRCGDEEFTYLLIGYTNAATTFEDGSQLFARGVLGDGGWACMNPMTGEFWGEAYGFFVGGAGRFEGASGTFTSPFVGNELYYPYIGVPSGIPFPDYPIFAIRGSIDGMVTFD